MPEKNEKKPTIMLSKVTRSFKQGQETLKVLQGIDLTVNEGEVVALIGPSGAGKSTLLHIAGLLEKNDGGNVVIAGNFCSDLSERQRTVIRRNYLGFVYQNHNLLPEFTALENVMLPQMVDGKKYKDAKDYALELLTKLKIAERASHRPSELSGGEQQRVAIARALANSPKLLLADEPTGNLDPATSNVVFEELIAIVKTTGLAAIIATHNPDLAGRMDRKVALRDGKLIEIDNYFVSRRT
ncbi:MAG: ABC transporter ATP-binding protein [Alphaproteobacteria bacterium]